jgi:hypothetical protein
MRTRLDTVTTLNLEVDAEGLSVGLQSYRLGVTITAGPRGLDIDYRDGLSRWVRFSPDPLTGHPRRMLELLRIISNRRRALEERRGQQ